MKVWSAPKLPAEIFATYRPKLDVTANYSIDDHAYLKSGNTSELFHALSKEVMTLDPCVTQEFLKYYVAFKAETNFVDVVPQAKRLLVMLNMRFPELDDPKQMSRDVGKKGRWGNGDVEVAFDSLDDLPYVIGLARQSLEKQLGNSDEV